MGVTVRFWGVRGSIASPSPDHVVYGGNTTCVEVTAAGKTLILDAGTGLRLLGGDLQRRGVTAADLFLTHYHWDHVSGLPFFAPGYAPGFQMRVHGPRLGADSPGVRAILSRQMEPPGFPVPLSLMRGITDFVDFEIGAVLTLHPDITVRTGPLNHPGGACGYRIECGGRAVCLITDTEHVPGRPDPAVLALIADADLMVYDSTYTDETFAPRVGWGHSTWQEGVRLARAAGVRRLAICHHDPDHDDRALAAIEAAAAARWSGAVLAREGMTLTL